MSISFTWSCLPPKFALPCILFYRVLALRSVANKLDVDGKSKS